MNTSDKARSLREYLVTLLIQHQSYLSAGDVIETAKRFEEYIAGMSEPIKVDE